MQAFSVGSASCCSESLECWEDVKASPYVAHGELSFVIYMLPASQLLRLFLPSLPAIRMSDFTSVTRAGRGILPRGCGERTLDLLELVPQGTIRS